jgi:hypothetical protein
MSVADFCAGTQGECLSCGAALTVPSVVERSTLRTPEKQPTVASQDSKGWLSRALALAKAPTALRVFAILVIAGIVVFAALWGQHCSDTSDQKKTQEKLASIHVGMTYAEVARVMGNGGTRSVSDDPGTEWYTWGVLPNVISVRFKDGLVTDKGWIGDF